MKNVSHLKVEGGKKKLLKKIFIMLKKKQRKTDWIKKKSKGNEWKKKEERKPWIKDVIRIYTRIINNSLLLNSFFCILSANRLKR